MAMREAIDHILHAEAEGKKLVAEARLKAEKMLADADVRAKEIMEHAVAEANESAKSKRALTRTESEAASAKILADADARAKQDALARSARLEAAVQKALEFLLR